MNKFGMIALGLTILTGCAAVNTTSTSPQTESQIPSATPLRVAKSILGDAEDEPPGFGAYSYLLTTNITDQRFLSALDGYLNEPSYCGVMQNRIIPTRVNLFLIPVSISRGEAISDIALHCNDRLFILNLIKTHYSTGRADVLEDRAGVNGSGPYLIASLAPLSELPAADRPKLLIWNLERVNPRLISLAVIEFVHAANEPEGSEGWQQVSIRRLVFDLRNWIEIASQSLGMSAAAAKEARDSILGD